MSEPEINSCSWFSHLLQVMKHSRRQFQKISRPLPHVTSLQTLLKLGPHSGESRLLVPQPLGLLIPAPSTGPITAVSQLDRRH